MGQGFLRADLIVNPYNRTSIPHNSMMHCIVLYLPISIASVVDEPERSGTPFRYLLFSRNAHSGTYCQISRDAFYLLLRYLFTMSGDDDYEYMTPRCFTHLQPLAETCVTDAHCI